MAASTTRRRSVPETPIPPTADLLTEALQHLHVDGIFYCRSELTAPFGARLPPMSGCLWFHVITRGTCDLVDHTGRVHRLTTGDVAVLPHGGGHAIVDRHDPSRHAPSVFDLPHEYLSPQFAILRAGGGGEAVELVCGAVRLGHATARHLTEVLPDLVSADTTSGDGVLAALPVLLSLMASETATPQPGGEAVVTRLCDIVVIATIRSWLERDEGRRTGWLGALRDPQIGPAVARIHREPERDWTVAQLASSVAMSRSAFAARFAELVGDGPVQYLTRWRMHVATDLLRTDRLTVAAVAERLGYGSEAAFGRAYKRVTGVPPGEVRRATTADLLGDVG
jgi:AraC-like DNA-binding protein